MDAATCAYSYLSRDHALIGDKPRFSGFQPADERTAASVSSKALLEPGPALVFELDAQRLRLRDHWPGEIGHFNISGGDVLVSQAVHDLIAPLRIDGLVLVPAVLEGLAGRHPQPLYVLSMRKRHDITDFARSEHLLPFDPVRDRSHRLLSIALDEEKTRALAADQRDIVMLDKVSPDAVLFSNALVAQLERANLTTGAVFHPLQDWFEGIAFQ